MAKFDRFMIAPINTGLELDLKPFMIPDDAFAALTNAYVFRGRVRKRFGSSLMNGTVSANIAQLYSRLRVKVGVTDGPGATAGNFTMAGGIGAIWKKGQLFSITGTSGTTIFTVHQANGATLTTGAATATFNTATGALAITGNGENPSADVYFYPAEPVMGLINYDSNLINDEPLFAFDTQFAYQYVAGAWTRLGVGIWTGNDTQFFSACNWRGALLSDFALFVTNFNSADYIKYWNGTTWTDLNPVVSIDGGNSTILKSARLIVAWKNRLIVFNTFEGVGAASAQFGNRARWCQNGTPLIATDVDAWREEAALGKGGFLDASTKEQIVSCGFIKDHLIVYFEKSTWEFVATGNEVQPFYWQRINSELGAESTFSAVPFDRVLLGMGCNGIHACNGANVERIDQKIPDEIFQISNNNDGVYRVNGIRDYYVQMVYWAFPSKYHDSKYPNRVLVYNYTNKSWAFNEDSITCFGYYQKQDDATWQNSPQTWESSINTWAGAPLESRFRQIIAGNQEGFLFIINPDRGATNAPALQITKITQTGQIVAINSIDHNLTAGEFIKIENCYGATIMNGKIYKINSWVDKDNFTVIEPSFVGTYYGRGTIARVSNINILTKQYNFYMSQGRNAYISKVDFCVDKTSGGQVTIDAFTGSSYNSLLQFGKISGALLGTNILETSPYTMYSFEQLQERLWHPIYLQADGECIQLRIYMNDVQMTDVDIAESDFELNAMTFYAVPTSSRMQ